MPQNKYSIVRRIKIKLIGFLSAWGNMGQYGVRTVEFVIIYHNHKFIDIEYEEKYHLLILNALTHLRLQL